MNKEDIKRLAQINVELKALGAEKAEINDRVLSEMIEEDAIQLRTGFGTFSIVHRRSYEYPQWFVEQQKELKLAEKKAKKESEYQVTKSLMFKPTKVLDVERREFEVEVVKEEDEGVEAKPVEKGQAKVH